MGEEETLTAKPVLTCDYQGHGNHLRPGSDGTQVVIKKGREMISLLVRRTC